MIAKVEIQLPYALNIPEGEKFNIYEFQKDGFKIRFHPFLKSPDADKHNNIENLKINGVPAFNADTLDIHFFKESFNREIDSDFDPPIQLISEVANDFLLRLRCVTGGYKIRPIDLQQCNMHLMYLNDDGTDLEEKEGFIRGRGTREFHFSFIAVNKKTWEDIHSLNPNKDLPIWKTLLLDANAVLPHIGSAVVLTFTALEVFISQTLDSIAKHKNVDFKLWEWINNRGFFLKNPSLEEQFDFLCLHLVGKSIKEDTKLWEGFKNLQSARNSFAHTGTTVFGGKKVDSLKVLEFIQHAQEIINFIKQYLPEELKWAEFKNEIKVEAKGTLLKMEGEKKESSK